MGEARRSNAAPVSLEFGASAFTGDKRWLEIAVRSPAGSGSFTTLTPRQPLTASPYALKALGVDGHSLDGSDGSPANALLVDATHDFAASSRAQIPMR